MTAGLVVYTCITAGYDELRPVRFPEPGVTYVCFGDDQLVAAPGWEVRPLPQAFAQPALANRYAKMHPHRLFPDHASSVYVDGNIEFGSGVQALARAALEHHDMAVYTHPFRDCVYQEALQCAVIGHDWIWNFERHMRRYRAEGLPPHRGLFEYNILFRRHHAAPIVKLMDAWWDEFLRGAKRDQLSFPYVTWRHPVRLNELGLSGIRGGQGVFRLHVDHRRGIGWRQLRGHANRLLPPYWLAALRAGG